MLLLVNVDDVSGEILPFIIEGLMDRGAGSVHVVQALTKKSRLEYLFFIDTPENKIDAMGSFLVAEIGTIGIRVIENRHIHFNYQNRQMQLTAHHPDQNPIQVIVRVKEIFNGEGRSVHIKAEHEDLRAALTRFHQSGIEISLVALKRLVEQLALTEGESVYQGIRAKFLGDNENEKNSTSIGWR